MWKQMRLIIIIKLGELHEVISRRKPDIYIEMSIHNLFTCEHECSFTSTKLLMIVKSNYIA